MSDIPNNEQGVVGSRKKPSIKTILISYSITIAFCLAFVLLFYILGLTSSFLPLFIVCLSTGITMNSLGIFLGWLFSSKPDNNANILIISIISCVGGGLIGWHIGFFFLHIIYSIAIDFSSRNYFENQLFAVVLGGIIAYFIYSHEWLKYTKKIAEKERLNRVESEKEALEANLRLLHAQIEPHFLFNTLSNIMSLIDTAPDKAKSMLMDFNLYLRTSLATTRPDMTTLDEEIDAIKAYLNIQKIRLGDRLDYSIDIPEMLLQQPFPPLLLQPLVENAVKHGLEPNIKGGEIKIKANGENGVMRIIVEDTGQGFFSYNKDGIGIKNIKERIKLIYGEKGHLSLEEKTPNGVEAIIEVPKNDI
ncbi:MAG: histidine kinase [Desulfobacteraceae bacterium]|jgi:sensor histidine kinase YesM